MKSGWEVRPLGEVVKLHYGKALPETQRSPSGAVPVYGANGVKDQSDRWLAEGPSYIIGRKGSAGEVTRTNGPFWPLDVTYFTEHDSERIDFDFLGYALPMLDLPSLAKGVKPGINREEVYGLSLPLPPLDEQKRIVAVLDDAFEGLTRARENAEANLTEIQELLQHVIDSCFEPNDRNDERAALGDLADILHGYAFDGVDFDISDDPSLPIVLTPGNYTEDGQLSFSCKNTKRLKSMPPEQYRFRPDDLSVVMTDLSSKMKILGKPAFIDRKDVLHNQRIGKFVFKSSELEPRIIYYFLRTSIANAAIKRTATGTMVKHTAPKRILGLEIAFPSAKSEQMRLVGRVAELERDAQSLKRAYAATLSDTDALRQSLLRAAFSGELT